MLTEPKKRRLLIAGIVGGVATLLLVGVVIVALRPTTVPDVTGGTQAQAKTLLEAVALRLGDVGQVATSTVGADTVLSQLPEAGARTPRRSSVDITVTVQPVDSLVPSVTGSQLSAAAETLANALYPTVPVDVFGATAPVGEVVDQAPGADATWTTGRPVAVAVAAGPDDGTAVEVPDLSGQSIEAALSKLAVMGLNANGLVRDLDRTEENVVVDQLPEGGTLVRPGTTVLLLFKAP